MTAGSPPRLTTRLARSEADLHAAQRLRYDVFVRELGAGGDEVDHQARREQDRFDPHCKHLLLLDEARPAEAQVVGVYRLLDRAGAEAAGQFYCEDEYDLSPLLSSGRPLLELGRSCLVPELRGGSAMLLIWQALAKYVADHNIELLFGVASLPGTDPNQLAGPLSLLHHNHLAPEAIRPRSRQFQPMDLLPPDQIDRKAAMRATPALIKAYLRLGGRVGAGAFVDTAFNCTDVCLIVDTAQVSARQEKIYAT